MPPLKLHLEGAAIKTQGKQAGGPAEKIIEKARDRILGRLHARRRRKLKQQLITTCQRNSKSAMEKAMVEAASTQPRESEQNPTTRRQEDKETKHYSIAVKSHVHTEWETRWNKYLDIRTNPTPAEERNCSKDTRQMRYKMTRCEDTVATLVRSECIGFKALLARVRVLGFEDPYCKVENRQRSILLCSTVPC